MRPEELLKALSRLIERESKLKDRIAYIHSLPHANRLHNILAYYHDQLRQVQLIAQLVIRTLQDNGK